MFLRNILYDINLKARNERDKQRLMSIDNRLVVIGG